jgi:hypothetical protein
VNSQLRRPERFSLVMIALYGLGVSIPLTRTRQSGKILRFVKDQELRMQLSFCQPVGSSGKSIGFGDAFNEFSIYKVKFSRNSEPSYCKLDSVVQKKTSSQRTGKFRTNSQEIYLFEFVSESLCDADQKTSKSLLIRRSGSSRWSKVRTFGHFLIRFAPAEAISDLPSKGMKRPSQQC